MFQMEVSNNIWKWKTNLVQNYKYTIIKEQLWHTCKGISYSRHEVYFKLILN